MHQSIGIKMAENPSGGGEHNRKEDVLFYPLMV